MVYITQLRDFNTHVKCALLCARIKTPVKVKEGGSIINIIIYYIYGRARERRRTRERKKIVIFIQIRSVSIALPAFPNVFSKKDSQSYEKKTRVSLSLKARHCGWRIVRFVPVKRTNNESEF